MSEISQQMTEYIFKKLIAENEELKSNCGHFESERHKESVRVGEANEIIVGYKKRNEELISMYNELQDQLDQAKIQKAPCFSAYEETIRKLQLRCQKLEKDSLEQEDDFGERLNEFNQAALDYEKEIKELKVRAVSDFDIINKLRITHNTNLDIIDDLKRQNDELTKTNIESALACGKESKQLKDRIDNLNQNNEFLATDNQKLNTANQAGYRAYEKLKKELSAEKSKVGELTAKHLYSMSEKENLRRNIVSLQKENAEYWTRLKGHAEREEALKIKYDKLALENKFLKNDNSMLDIIIGDSKIKYDKSIANNTALEKEVVRLRGVVTSCLGEIGSIKHSYTSWRRGELAHSELTDALGRLLEIK